MITVVVQISYSKIKTTSVTCNLICQLFNLHHIRIHYCLCSQEKMYSCVSHLHFYNDVSTNFPLALINTAAIYDNTIANQALIFNRLILCN